MHPSQQPGKRRLVSTPQAANPSMGRPRDDARPQPSSSKSSLSKNRFLLKF